MKTFFRVLVMLFLCGIMNAQIRFAPADSIPDDFPTPRIKVNTAPTDGYLFLASFPSTFYLTIVNNDGVPVYYKDAGQNVFTDFKLQPNGLMTYFNFGRKKFYGMNEDFEIVDSFYCGNGFETDEHELRITPDGRIFMFGLDKRTVDMSEYVSGGDTNAVVTFMVIQEQDAARNVVWEWNTYDHLDIMDCTPDVNMVLPIIDYAHCNAIDIDTDGNILLSTRHFDEISKINYQTGEFIWRMGGSRCANNEFTFIDDTQFGFTGFSHQHAVRRLANGHLLLFDNGNLKVPKFTRAVEYEVDEVNKTATRVWEYKPAEPTYSNAMGYVQRLENGNTLIGWGMNDTMTVSEVTSAGTLVYDMAFPDGVWSYRALRFDLDFMTGDETALNTLNYLLSQNYPNPFNPSTSIRYYVPSSDWVSLKVYDMLGEEVSTVYEGDCSAGWHTAQFDASNLSSGIYIYRLVSASFTDSKKMLFVK